jgi:hypothetical protein
MDAMAEEVEAWSMEKLRALEEELPSILQNFEPHNVQLKEAA